MCNIKKFSALQMMINYRYSLFLFSVSIFSDKPIPHSHTVFENNKAQLKVRAADLEDAGVYTCVAVNDHGRAVSTARVLVKGKTHIFKSI